MAYAWQTEAEREVTPQAPRIPKGQHPVRIERIVFGNRNGPFQSQGGDPQIMLVFQDRLAREASQMVTLSEKAAFVLARLLGACDPPVNLARMEQDGIEPAQFAREDFANQMLVNRQLTIEVDYEPGKDGKEYPRVIPVPNRSAMPPASPADDGPPSTDDGPGCARRAAAMPCRPWPGRKPKSRPNASGPARRKPPAAPSSRQR